MPPAPPLPGAAPPEGPPPTLSPGPSAPAEPRRRRWLWYGWALVAGLAYWAMSPPRLPSLDPLRPPKPVPSGFLWGAATAGTQWEGGDRHSNWAQWVREGKVQEAPGRAADGWHRWGADLDLARGLGLNAFRFSLEWARLEPQEGVWDEGAWAHYRELLKGCRTRGLEPILTLLHYAYPAWLDRPDAQGLSGWEAPHATQAYRRFVTKAARELGPWVRYYLTFNEPTVMVEAGYLGGMWPPGKQDPAAFLRASAQLLQAHREAHQVLHELDPDAQVSFNNYAAAYQLAWDPKADGQAVPGDDWFLAGLARLGLGTSLAGRPPLDFVALDYYKKLTFPVQLIPPSPSEWRVFPEGFVEVLSRYHKAFGLPILIAENGLATNNGQPRADGWTREAYIVQHVAWMQEAMAQGIPVLGYTYWTLTDNWEWGSFDDRFGLFAVECRRADLARVRTPSAEVYARIVRQGGVDVELLKAHPRPGGGALSRPTPSQADGLATSSP